MWSPNTPLEPSTNPLGSPVISNSPVESLIQTNDAEVKIPVLGVKIRPTKRIGKWTRVRFSQSHPTFHNRHFQPINDGYPPEIGIEEYHATGNHTGWRPEPPSNRPSNRRVAAVPHFLNERPPKRPRFF